jgi:hypothetical protein
MAGGEGGDSEWAKALRESTGPIPGAFDKDMQKMQGLGLGGKSEGNPKLTANSNLIDWLKEQGDVYLAEVSSWGEAPHPMGISTETKDEITNESSGRGLLARRDINDGDNLFKIPLKLCLTKASARKAVGKQYLSRDINEYLAIACQLIHERFIMRENSFWKPYMDILPEVGEVNPTFTWSEEDLVFLEGSPVIAATKSLQMKLQREYDALLGGENGLCNKYPDAFPKEVRRRRRTTEREFIWLFETRETRMNVDCWNLTFVWLPIFFFFETTSTTPMRIGYGPLPCSFPVPFDYAI